MIALTPTHDPREPALRLLIATRNDGKLREFRNLLAGLPIAACSLAEFPGVPEADEPHETFRDNARRKALFYAARTEAIALADDSGLEVEALGGAPGVRSARYGGAGLTSDERNRLLLSELASIAEADRRARFRCFIAVARPDANIVLEAEGVCEGRIALSPRGANGFGYDPVFIPENHDATFAELDAETKDRTSHRGRAARRARELLAAWLARRTAP